MAHFNWKNLSSYFKWHLANNYITLTIQSEDNDSRIADWFDFFFDEKITFHFSACVFYLVFMWKKSTFNIGCLCITYWCGNRYIYTLHHFEYMHFFKVHYEVKFHFLFLIFHQLPFLKIGSTMQKVGEASLDGKGTWFSPVDIISHHGGVERMLKGILCPQFSRAHELWKLRELIVLNSFEKLLLLLRAIGKFNKWNFITMDGKARQTSTLPIANGFQFQMGIF